MTVRLDKTWWTRTQYRIYHSASVDQELIFFIYSAYCSRVDGGH